MITMRFILSSLFLLQSFVLLAQSTIMNGPMQGYSTMTEVGIWIQIDGIESIKLEYWKVDEADVLTVLPSESFPNEHIYKFIIENLTPGTEYEYQVMVNGGNKLHVSHSPRLTFKTQELWQYRTDPPPLKIALGSCNYINEESMDRPGRPYGSVNGIFNSITQANPDLMLWLGDNIYLREPDFQSWSGYIHRHTHTRSAEELQKLLSSTNNYAIWDDHDFGPNDADGSWIHKDWALKSFEMFWMNPSTGLPGEDGITTSFRYGDVDFFLLDNRYNRTSKDAKHITPQILGKSQIDWLIEAMKYSRAPFKFVAVGGQVVNDAAVYENHAQFAEERDYLLNRISEEQIKGVVFLTGDRHHSELSMVEIDGIKIYDLTVSPLTSGTHDAKDEPNSNRLDGTHVAEHNFGILEITGERLARELNISIFDKSGEVIWSKLIER